MGGTLIFSYIRFVWFKILNFKMFGGFQKNYYFLYEDSFVDPFCYLCFVCVCLTVLSTRPRSAVVNVSDCRYVSD